MTPALDWLHARAAMPDEAARGAAEERQRRLTKPFGALGRLESLAIRLAALQGADRPRADRVHITVFAADHGIAAEGVSAFPQAVTGEMVRNFARGGAAISVLARELDASFEVVDLGTVNDPGPLEGVIADRLAPASANLARDAAMDAPQLARALHAGRAAAERGGSLGAHLFIGGEMGIGNTTAAAALVCALLDLPAEEIAGPGAGLDTDGVERKIDAIRRALDRHRAQVASPLEALRRLGGFEIAALAGSYVACAQGRVPVLVDGFVAGAAALAAVHLCPGAEAWMVHAHVSAEPGHRKVLAALGAHPLLDLGMRLGEGSGAAIAVPLLRMACALHNRMATFAEAGVSEKAS